MPLSTGGGGFFNVNREVTESAKAAVEARFGADYVYLLNPGTLDADLPKGVADGKFGTTSQIPVLFDGRGLAPADSEAPVSEGYVGKCAM